MKTNKTMYNDYCEAMKMVERYKHWDYIDNYKDMKREEKLYDKYCDIANELIKAMAKLPKSAKLTVYRWSTVYDLETGKKCDRVKEEMTIYAIGKQSKDDIVLFECNGHVYTGETVKELGWKTYKKNGKVVYDDVYYK
jgi:hypothetical protein